MNFLLGILEGGGSVDEHPLIQQLLDLFWLLMEVRAVYFLLHKVHSFAHNLVTGLEVNDQRSDTLCQYITGVVQFHAQCGEHFFFFLFF